jgi:DNA-binding response OmpR family regulator
MHIILVEDEQDQRELVAGILEANEMKVTQADSVESAIVTLKNLVDKTPYPT